MTCHRSNRALSSLLLVVLVHLSGVVVLAEEPADSDKSSPALAGPVTCLVPYDGAVYSCTQAGVHHHGPGGATPICSPPWRVVAMTLVKAGDDRAPAFVICGGEPGVSGMAAVWNPASKSLTELKIGDDLAYSVSSFSTKSFFALADGRVVEISVTGGELDQSSVREIHRHTAAARCVVVSKDGGHLVSAGMDGVVLVSPLNNPDQPAITIQDHTDRLDRVAFSPGQNQIVSGARDGKVRIHDLEGKLIRTYPTLPGEVSAIYWNGTGEKEKLIVGTSRGGIHYLDPAKNDTLRSHDVPDPVGALAVGPSGHLEVGGLARIHRMKKGE